MSESKILHRNYANHISEKYPRNESPTASLGHQQQLGYVDDNGVKGL